MGLGGRRRRSNMHLRLLKEKKVSEEEIGLEEGGRKGRPEDGGPKLVPRGKGVKIMQSSRSRDITRRTRGKSAGSRMKEGKHLREGGESHRTKN